MSQTRLFKKPLIAAMFCAALSLGACAGDADKKPLEGERITLFNAEATQDTQSTSATDDAQTLPAVWTNSFWPQAGGYANHTMGNLQLADKLSKQWSADIGAGSTDDLPLTAPPIVADGRVYTIDTDNEVRAFDAATGRRLWSTDAMPEHEDSPVINGGLAFSGGRLFVNAGFNELLAIDPAKGSILWRKTLENALRGAPTAMPERVYVVGVNNTTFALDATNGDVIWTHQGMSETTGLLGGASPAANRDIVLPAYSSGELYALAAETGATLWSETIAPLTAAGSGLSFSDIRALPVIDHGVALAISYAGRMAAIDERTGERLWQASLSGAQTPLLVGNRTFVISADNFISNLDLKTGKALWRTPLPRFEDPEDLEDPITWYGPILANGRLLALSSIGTARDIDPKTGKTINLWQTGQNVIAAPIVAQGTLYMLSANGTLTAWK